MMKHIEMVKLVSELFMDAYLAGIRPEGNSINNAIADRERMYSEVKQLYDRIESLSADLEFANRELEKERDEHAATRGELANLSLKCKNYLNTTYGFCNETLIDPEDELTKNGLLEEDE